MGTKTESQVPKLREIILSSLGDLSPQKGDALHNGVVHRFYAQTETLVFVPYYDAAMAALLGEDKIGEENNHYYLK